MGVMANAGIKSESAGTALRAGMLRMTKPTKDMIDVMDEYGISITNSDGSMKTLMEVMEMYRSKLGGLTEAEKAKAAATLFGTEAASGWLGVINASPEAFAEMTEAIYNSEGAAQDMAKTMQDNLKSDVEQLGGALESVGLTAYEGFSNPLRQAVQDVTKTLTSYDVAKLINGITYEIGGLAQGLADKLPGAIKGVVGFLQTLIDNIDAISAGVKAFIATWAILKGLGILMAIGGLIAKVAALISGLIAGTVTIGGVTVALGGMSAALAAATGGISLIVAGIAFLATKLFDGKSKSDEFSDAFMRSANSLTKFQWGIDNLQPSLAGLNDLTSASGKSMSDLDTIISTAEANITKTMTDEFGNQKTLREEDIKNIKAYNQQIYEAKLEQLEIQRQQQAVELEQLKYKLSTQGQLTQEAAAQAVVDAKAAYEQSAQATQEFYDSEFARIYSYYEQKGMLESEEYKKALDKLTADTDAQVAANEAKRDEMIRIALEESVGWVNADAEKWANLANNAKIGKKEYASIMESMNLENAKAFMQMVSTANSEGVELTEETKQIARDMLGAFDNLPKNMQVSGTDALRGLISGMEGQIDGLEDTSEMTAEEIVDAIEKELGIASPSRVLKTIGEYAAKGLINGLTSMQNSLSTKAKNIATQLIEKLKPGASKIQDIGENIMSGIGAGLSNKNSWLGSKISSLASGIVSKFKSAFSINSPSRIMRDTIGLGIVEGIGVGIDENTDEVTRPIVGLVDHLKGIDVAGAWGKLSGANTSLSYDVSAQLGDYVSNAIESNSPYTLLGSLIDAVEDLASRAIVLDIDGTRFATATAGATDNVSGNRLNLKQRGLAL